MRSNNAQKARSLKERRPRHRLVINDLAKPAFLTDDKQGLKLNSGDSGIISDDSNLDINGKSEV